MTKSYLSQMTISSGHSLNIRILCRRFRRRFKGYRNIFRRSLRYLKLTEILQERQLIAFENLEWLAWMYSTLWITTLLNINIIIMISDYNMHKVRVQMFITLPLLQVQAIYKYNQFRYLLSNVCQQRLGLNTFIMFALGDNFYVTYIKIA